MLFNDYMKDALAIGDVCAEFGLGSADTILYNYIHGRYFPGGLSYFIGGDKGELDGLLKDAGLNDKESIYMKAKLMNSQPDTFNEESVLSVLVDIHDCIYDNRIPELEQKFSRIRLFIDPDFRESKMIEYNRILTEIVERSE